MGHADDEFLMKRASAARAEYQQCLSDLRARLGWVEHRLGELNAKIGSSLVPASEDLREEAELTARREPLLWAVRRDPVIKMSRRVLEAMFPDAEVVVNGQKL